MEEVQEGGAFGIHGGVITWFHIRLGVRAVMVINAGLNFGNVNKEAIIVDLVS